MVPGSKQWLLVVELFLWNNTMSEFSEYEDPQEMECFSCNVSVNITKKQCGPHLGAFCNVCGMKIRHLKKLKNLNKRKSKDYTGELSSKASKGYAFCSICYRPSTMIIAKTGLKLEIHHIREVQHDGTEDPENLLVVCCDCHNIIHSIRMITHRNLNTWRK